MISACLPPQLVSVSSIAKLMFLTLFLLSRHVMYFLEGHWQVGTYFSNSFNSCGVTTAFCNRSRSRVSIMPLL